MPRISIATASSVVAERPPAARPAGPTARSSSRGRRRSSPNVEPHLQVRRRQGGHDGVAPLDERDAAVVEQLADAEVGQLAQAVEAVDVEVVDRQAAGVLRARA